MSTEGSFLRRLGREIGRVVLSVVLAWIALLVLVAAFAGAVRVVLG